MSMSTEGPEHSDSGLNQPELSSKVPATRGGLIEIGPALLGGHASETRPTPRAPSASLNVLVYLRALGGCWRLAFAVAVPSAFLVAAAAWRLLPPPSYTAQALLAVAV